MKGYIKRFGLPALAVLTLYLMAGLLAACSSGDGPPGSDTPAPPALDGVFSSKLGTLSFNRDGRSIALDLEEEFAEAAGLPAGESEASYVFLFHNEEWRYDKAETFRIILGEENVQFTNDLSLTDEDTVAFFYGDGETAVFEKE